MNARRRKDSVSIPVRLIRSISAILILSALVLVIAQTVKVGSKLTSNAISDKKDVDTKVDVVETSESTKSQDNNKSPESSEVKFKVALLSDSHEDDEMLKTALDRAKSLDVKAVFYLGDYTNFGVIDNLKHTKEIMDASGLTYYSLPGDHDLYKSVGPENFIAVFGKNYTTVSIEDIKFVLLDNSANYTKIPNEEYKWFKDSVADANFLLLSQPVYANFLNRKMGIVNGEVEPDALAQAYDILRIVRSSGVFAILSGDLHMSGEFTDPEKLSLRHYYVGAIAKSSSEDGVINLQSPKFSLLTIYKNNSYKVEDIKL